MKKDTTKTPVDVAEEKLFDNWFDPIETELRTKVRGFIEAMIEAELATALARPRYGRRLGLPVEDGTAAPIAGHRHGRRTRSLTGTFGRTEIAVPRARIIDELGYVPFTAIGSELLFEVFSQRYERGATLVTSNLPFDEWTLVFGSERLTGALLDRLTHHVHILEMNGDSYRLATAKKAQRRSGNEKSETTTTKGDADAKI